jgi:HK97 family phage major capsid protein
VQENKVSKFVESERQRLNALATEELRKAEELVAGKQTIDKTTRTKAEIHLNKAAQYRREAAQLFGSEDALERVNAAREEMGLPELELPTSDQRNMQASEVEFRNYLYTGLYQKRAMSVGSDANGGFFVPTSFYAKVTEMLAAVDPLFDPNVVTVWESDHGNSASTPIVDDHSAAAVKVGEGIDASDQEITVAQLSLAKVDTWRSKKIVASMELAADAAIPLEALIGKLVAKRFRRGIGSANVTTLISQSTSALTTASIAAGITLDNVIDLISSVDADYQASPNFRVLMNQTVLTGLLKAKDSGASRYQKLVLPTADGTGFTILGKRIAVSPSLASVAANSVPVIAGDLSYWFQRVVRNSMTILRYQNAPGLVEQGNFAYEAFWRTNGGLLTTGTQAPAKFITVAAT